MAVVRNVAGVIAGIVVSQAVVFGFDSVGDLLYPVSGDIAAFDQQRLAAWMAAIPLQLKLIMTLGWACAAFAGPWIALRITDRKATGWGVSAVFLAGSVLNQVNLPHPLWMLLCAVLFPVAGGWLAQRAHRKPFAGEALLG